MTVQEIVRALLERGLTQVEIQRRTGIPQFRLSRWGAGRVPAGAADALRLRELHDELIGVDGAPQVPVAEEARDAQ